MALTALIIVTGHSIDMSRLRKREPETAGPENGSITGRWFRVHRHCNLESELAFWRTAITRAAADGFRRCSTHRAKNPAVEESDLEFRSITAQIRNVGVRPAIFADRFSMTRRYSSRWFVYGRPPRLPGQRSPVKAPL